MSSSAGAASTSPRGASKTSCAPAYPPLLHQNRHQPATLRQPRTAKTGAAQSACAQVLYHEYPVSSSVSAALPSTFAPTRIGSAHPRCLSLDPSPNAVNRGSTPIIPSMASHTRALRCVTTQVPINQVNGSHAPEWHLPSRHQAREHRALESRCPSLF